MEYYVYRWIRLDNNTPFYVGKGIGRRYKRTETGRNKYFRHIIKAVPTMVEIIISGLSEKQAFEKEIEFIRLYKNLGYCEANFTMGGEGELWTQERKQALSVVRTGTKLSESAKIKLSEFQKGQTRSANTRAKMGASKSKRVVDLTSGFVYSSVKEASRSTLIKYSVLVAMLNGQNKNKTTLRYEVSNAV